MKRERSERVIVSLTFAEAAALRELERQGLWDRTTKRALSRIARSLEHVTSQQEKPKGEV